MNAIIICGWPDRGDEHRPRKAHARLPIAAAAAAFINLRLPGHISAILTGLFCPPGIRRETESSVQTPIRLLPFNFTRPLKASGSLIPFGHSALRILQDSLRCCAEMFHMFSSAPFHVRNMAWGSRHEVHRKSASGAQSSE